MQHNDDLVIEVNQKKKNLTTVISKCLLATAVLIVSIKNLRLEESAEGIIERGALKKVKADIHHLIGLVRLPLAGKAFHLAKQRSTKNLLHHSVCSRAHGTCILLSRHRFGEKLQA